MAGASAVWTERQRIEDGASLYAMLERTMISPRVRRMRRLRSNRPMRRRTAGGFALLPLLRIERVTYRNEGNPLSLCECFIVATTNITCI
jgi:hypothetical protein